MPTTDLTEKCVTEIMLVKTGFVKKNPVDCKKIYLLNWNAVILSSTLKIYDLDQ